MATKAQVQVLIEKRPEYKIPMDSIYFVATKGDWSYCESRLREALFMGFDTETRPQYVKGRPQNPPATLQIGVRDAHGKEEVFVIDLLHLPPTIYNKCLTDVFISKKAIKFGQGFYQDLRELAEAYPKATCFCVVKRVVEVNDISAALAGGGHNAISLQNHVFFYLNCKLLKTQQTSNWARRPLSADQLHYAAADALALIHIYDVLAAQLAIKRPDFDVDTLTDVFDVSRPLPFKCLLCFEVFPTNDDLKRHKRICTASQYALRICSGCDATLLVSFEQMLEHENACEKVVKNEDEIPLAPVGAPPIAMPNPRKRTRSAASKPTPVAVAEAPAAVKLTKKAIEGAANAAKAAKEAAKFQRQLAAAAAAMAADKQERKAAKTLRKREKQAQLVAAAAKQQQNGKATPAAVEATTTTQSAKRNLSKLRRKLRREAEREAAGIVAQAPAPSTTPSIPPAAAAAAPTQQQKPSAASRKKLKRRKLSVESSVLASDAIWSQVSTDNSISVFST